MNMSSSECTSGCESGWTMYLDQSVNSGYDDDEKCEKGGRHSNGKWPYVSMERDEDDEDDLSMVSDASSGPRQKFDEDEEHKYGFDYGAQTTNKARSKVRLNEKKTSNDVDDTASSTYISKAKSGLLKKGSSVAKKCVSNKSGEIKKGCDFAAQGSRELGSARKN